MPRKKINNNGKIFWINELSIKDIKVDAKIETINNEIKEIVFEEKHINIEPEQVELVDESIKTARTSKKSRKPRKPRKPRGSKTKE